MNVLSEELFISQHRGKQTALYTLGNKNGMVVQITNFGAKVAAVFVPDRNGSFEDVVLGYKSIQSYISGNPYFGAICGRYANRIAGGTFTIDGREYRLPVNNGPNSLHGGPDGFNNQVFEAGSVTSTSSGTSIQMVYHSLSGEMGYPGNLTLKVTYQVTDFDELCIDYEAVTDEPTHVNICSHSFFNLAGAGKGSILDHELQILATRFTPVNEHMIPLGLLQPVKDTPMDFTAMCSIGSRIDEPYEQLRIGKGYDHNWVLDKAPGELALAAICQEPVTGRKMEVYTTQPGMQLYTGNWLDGSDIGKAGKAYTGRSAVCLETQHFPDSPHQPGFPSTLLKHGEGYKNSCIYKFSVMA